jgi:hypothetical protein
MWQDRMKELRDGLGDKADMIVADAPFERSNDGLTDVAVLLEKMPVSRRVPPIFFVTLRGCLRCGPGDENICAGILQPNHLR